VRIPPEAMNQLRFGRGVDNRRYKAAGFGYQYTSRETVLRLGEHLRLHPVIRDSAEPYRYEREVEEFLRWSPHVAGARDRGLPPGAHGGALERAEAAELRALAAERMAERALERAKKAERRSAESALKATERAKKAERRARAAAEDAVERVNLAVSGPAAAPATEPAEPQPGAGEGHPGAPAPPASRPDGD
jgi:hypothetical protein